MRLFHHAIEYELIPSLIDFRCLLLEHIGPLFLRALLQPYGARVEGRTEGGKEGRREGKKE